MKLRLRNTLVTLQYYSKTGLDNSIAYTIGKIINHELKYDYFVS